MEKHCFACNTTKPDNGFHKNKAQKDGLATQCKECSKIRGKKYRENNKDKVRDYLADYYQQYKDKLKKRSNDWYHNNKEYASERCRKYRKENWDKILEGKREYNRRNPKKGLEKVRRRQMQKLQATPCWSDLDKIKKIYENGPNGMEVDHIVPIRGETVCGLHVPENLQYLDLSSNRKKRNCLPRDVSNGLYIKNPFDKIDKRKMLS